MLGSADYTATDGLTVVLASGATAGDLVEVISFSVSSVLNAIPGTTGAVGTTYLADSSVTQAKLGAGVAGNGPVFSSNMSANQTISSATFTKVVFNLAPSFGTATNGWDTVNNRFQPTVAGYYLVTGCVYATGAGWADQSLVIIYKNGGGEIRCQDTGAKLYNLTVNGMVYLNGTTDYLEIYAYSSSSKTIESSSSLTWVRGVLLRAA
jgi:hypothetical protein